MNSFFVLGLDKGIRIDARDDKEGVSAAFSTDEEKFAYKIKSEVEIDYHDNHLYPDKGLMKFIT